MVQKVSFVHKYCHANLPVAMVSYFTKLLIEPMFGCCDNIGTGKKRRGLCNIDEQTVFEE